jgi:ABC-type sugar transport system ATPase subunit
MAEVVLSGVRTAPHEGRRALDGVDLAVGDGELLALLGGSGSGKTTLLRAIAGLVPVESGTVVIGGVDVTGVPTRERDLAMVVQDDALLPHLTTGGNIGFGLRLRRLARGEVARRVADEARVVRLGELLDRRPNTLSGGERQLTGIARATVRAPAVSLLDEPFARLDPRERARVRAELAAVVRRRGTTAILVTNDPIEAMVVGDRVAVLEDGRIAQVGTPAELYARPASTAVAARVGDPPMALLPGVLAPGARACWVRLGAQAVAVPRPPAALLAELEGADVVVGIRPEHAVAAAPHEPGDGSGGAALTAEVRHVEVLGPHALLHVAIAGVGAPLVCRAPTALGSAVRPGDAVSVRVSADGPVLFEGATGLLLPVA